MRELSVASLAFGLDALALILHQAPPQEEREAREDDPLGGIESAEPVELGLGLAHADGD